MIEAAIPRLHDICVTSIVYRLWTRQDIYENWDENHHWQLLESQVTSDVKSLPLPERVKPLLLSIVKPSGRHFFGFLNIWLTKMATSEKWLTRGLLYDCLTLYAVGIINQRKTAEKILRSQTLDNTIAFRLACVNFLEGEVLRLWPDVYQFILKKIVHEHNELKFIGGNFFPIRSSNFCCQQYGYVQETCEVLFWIGYCLSKMRGTSLSEVPHYSGYTENWYSHALGWADISGDVSFFEYVINSSNSPVFIRHEDQIKRHCLRSDNYLISFFYHFSLLKTDRKVELFRRHPLKLTLYFLQWPLSSLFLDHLNHHQEIFNELLKQNMLDWLLATILEILNHKSYLGQNFCDKDGNNAPRFKISGVYNVDHMEQIWIALWKLCPDETKSRIMDSFVFVDNLRVFLETASYKMNFDASTLMKDIWELFRLHGEAILKFLEEENLADALEKVISNYMPERKLHFRFLQLPQFYNKPNYEIIRTVGETNFKYMLMVKGLKLPVSFHRIRYAYYNETIIHSKIKFDIREIKNLVVPNFINYIQSFF